MKRLDWDDLRLFLAVARAGGLSAAAAGTGLSPATLGRRMTALERRIGTRLFRRRRDGYDLTEAGRDLVSRSAKAETAMLSIERWSAEAPLPAIRIASGAWTGAFLAAHVEMLAGTKPRLAIEILTGAGLVDLLRREADLGIRNRRPTTTGLAGRRLGPVTFALYGAPKFLADNPSAASEDRWADCDWVLFAPPDDAEIPSAAWLDRRMRRAPVLRCTDPRNVADAVAGGAGLCVLPCFVGDRDERLSRASPPIAELDHEQWLVSHDEDRHDRHIRVAAARITELIRSRPDLFAGRITTLPAG